MSQHNIKQSNFSLMSPVCVCVCVTLIGLVSTDAHGGALLRLPQDEGDTGVSVSLMNH